MNTIQFTKDTVLFLKSLAIVYGQTVDVPVEERRNKKAAKHFIKKLRKQVSTAIRSVTTGKLKTISNQLLPYFQWQNTTMFSTKIIGQKAHIK